MDILEAGMDRPEREPSRPRTVGLAVAAVAIAGGAFWLHQPDKPPTPPAPVAASSSAAPTPTPSPSPTATKYPFHADVVRNVSLSCAQFLAAVKVLPEGSYGLHMYSDYLHMDKAHKTGTRDVTYKSATGTATVHAQCGPTIWGGPVGQHVGDANEQYIDIGAWRTERGGPRPEVAIFRADNADGWYSIRAGGPDGRLRDGATIGHLMGAFAGTPLIDWKPPGLAGQD